MEISLQQEELAQLQELKEVTNRLVASLGDIALQKARLEIIEAGLKEELRELMLKEQTASEQLVQKYGPISINLERGIATSMS
jgi:hypothetical protein